MNTGAELKIAETAVREFGIYADAYGSANKTTGRRPQKIVCKTGEGHLLLEDVIDNRNATVAVLGGVTTVSFTDADLVDQINADGRAPGDYVDPALEFTLCHSDGTLTVSSSTVLIK